MIEATQIGNIRRLETLQKKLSKNFWLLVLISLAHLPFGVLIYAAKPVAIIHPAAVFFIGMYWAVQREFRLERVALAIGYLVGAEVLWRMAGVPVFWEFGKYGSVAIAIAALVRRGHYKIPKLPLAYFLLLVPACFMTLVQNQPVQSQAILSSQMSGPLFLFVACWFCSYLRLSSEQLRRLLFSILVPLFSVAFATLFFTVTSEEIQFTGESNLATSGGFGPNQVSSMLGLGAFVALAALLVFRNITQYRIYLLLAAIFFTAQSVMTFSRGGMYNAIGAFIVVFLIEFQRPSEAMKRLTPVIVLILVFFVLVFPVMNAFTGGKLGERFEDTGTTNRAEIAESDVQLFFENPVFGVGVGASYDLRAQILEHKAVSHTEFSRLISEHGMFGVLALILLVVMVISNFRRQPAIMGRAMVAGAAVWCCLFMINAGMRMAAPSFMWGLMFATIVNPRPKLISRRSVASAKRDETGEEGSSQQVPSEKLPE